MIDRAMIRVEASCIAPVPVGHRVTILAVDALVTPIAIFSPSTPVHWEVSKHVIVCDEDTRIVYADVTSQLHDDATYDQLTFKRAERRISQLVAPLRGVVRACTVITDNGDQTYMRTLLHVEPDPAPAATT
jgi:hypothetical protein